MSLNQGLTPIPSIAPSMGVFLGQIANKGFGTIAGDLVEEQPGREFWWAGGPHVDLSLSPGAPCHRQMNACFAGQTPLTGPLFALRHHLSKRDAIHQSPLTIQDVAFELCAACIAITGS